MACSTVKSDVGVPVLERAHMDHCLPVFPALTAEITPRQVPPPGLR